MSFLSNLIPFLPLAETVVRKIIGDDPIIPTLERAVLNKSMSPETAAKHVMDTMSRKGLVSTPQGWLYQDPSSVQNSRAPLNLSPIGTNFSNRNQNLQVQQSPLLTASGPNMTNQMSQNLLSQSQMEPLSLQQSHQLSDIAEQQVANPNVTLKSLHATDPAQLNELALNDRLNSQPKLSHNQTTQIVHNNEQARSTLEPQTLNNYSSVSLPSWLTAQNKEAVQAPSTINNLINNNNNLSNLSDGAIGNNDNSAANNADNINANLNALNKTYETSDTTTIPNNNTSQNNDVLKIIGDEPLNLTDNAGNKTVKIVGDAPNRGTRDQKLGALGTFGSFLTSIKASIVAIEQTMQNGYKVKPLTSREEFLRDVRLSFSYSASLYQKAEAYKCDYLQGMNFYPRVLTYNRGLPREDQFQVDNAGMIYFSDTICRPARNAPPLLSNVTWNTLVPLMKNTSITEFSSALRIRVRGTDMDVMSNAVLKAMPNFDTSSGYSFATRLAKAIGYVLSYNQFNRADFNNKISGLYRPASANMSAETTGTWFIFPLSYEWKLMPTREERRQYFAGTTIAVTDYSSYVDNLLGRTTNWHDAFAPNNLGTATAVVFLTQAEAMNKNIVMARTLLEMDYPAVFLETEPHNWFTVDENSRVTEIRETATADTTYINTAHIAGPMRSILYVIYDAESWNDNQVVMGVDVINARPSEPEDDPQIIFNNTADFFEEANAFASFMDEIRHWEMIYGNNSDRATALRWAAENCINWAVPSQTGVAPAGANNPMVGLMYSGMLNNPFRQASYNYFQYDRMAQLILYNTSPTYMFRDFLGRPYPYDDNRLPTRTVINAPNYTLPLSNHIIDFLVNKNWLKCAEESPQITITDPNSLTCTVNDISEALSTAADIILETEGCPMAPLFNARVDYPEQMQTFWATFMSRRIYPQLGALLTDGIQYPNLFRNSESDNRIKSYLEGEFHNFYPNNWDLPNVFHYSISRVPFSTRAKFVPNFNITDPRVNFSLWSTKQVTYRDYFNNMVRTAYGVEMQDLPVFRAYTMKLSLAFTGDGQKNIDYPMFVTDKSRNLEMPTVSVLAYDNWLAIQITYSPFTAGSVPTTFLSRPIGRIWPTWSVNFGGEKLILTMMSPRAAFARNSSTLDIRMVTEQSADEPFIAAQIWSDITSPIFNFSSQLQNASNFI